MSGTRVARFLVHWAVMAVALGATAYLLPGIHIASWPALAVGALVLGFVNAVIRPILIVLTLPLSVMTLGVFALVVNGIAFGLAAAVVPGFDIDSPAWAVGGALVASLVSWWIGRFIAARG